LGPLSHTRIFKFDPSHSIYALTFEQHPLLEKYGFDFGDFMVGARESFAQLHQLIQTEEFRNYTIGFFSHLSSFKLLEKLKIARLWSF
jgi:hypothetical protein